LQETKISGIKAFLYTTTDSTNERAKQYAKTAWNGEPTVFLAEEQTSGRGRYSRKFHSKSGAGVYLSLLFKPNSGISDTTPIVAHTANSMISAIETLAPVIVNIKWVNDLVLNEKKLGGILIEGAINPESREYDYLIIGIGVNLYRYEMDEEIKSIATSLEAECGKKVEKDNLISIFLERLLSGLNAPDSQDTFDLYKSRLITPGKAVTVKTVTEEYDATAIDLLPDYSLLVRTPAGDERRIYTGEVKIITKKA
jgi:BirA family biotin operon repressor/biotin-[acetyl-CoA-carboxylase] ligase